MKAWTMGEGGLAPRQRLSAEVRRRQIIDAAAALVLEQGHLPLPLEKLAGRVGVSKGLIYGYFPTQPDLFNAILHDELAALERSGLAAMAASGDLTADAQACCEVYLRHIAARGPVAHFILRDTYMARNTDPDATRLRDRLFRRFARRVRRDLRLPAAEAVATVVLVLAIPEEMGRLIWQGEMPLERGAELARELVASAIAALRPAGSVA